MPAGEQDSPIDAVWTWVSSDADAGWRAALDAAIAAALPPSGCLERARAATGNKFRDHGELRFSMRSVFAHAPWVRTLWVVTADAAQLPAWLDVAHPRIRVVHHAELFDDAAAQLPTFNSLAIETVLHRIPGLAPRWLYLNNDFMLGRATTPEVWAPPGAHVELTDFRIAEPKGPCAAVLMKARAREAAPPPPLPAESAAEAGCRASEAHFYNAQLSRWAWDAPVLTWPAHVPRLFYTRVLEDIAARLAPQVAVARRNALRDAQSDVEFHVQHEAYLRAAQHFGAGQKRVSAADLRKNPDAYVFVVFDSLKSEAVNEQLYSKLLAALVARPPAFFAIDDDMKGPTTEQIAFHGRWVRRLMRALAPDAAPWELDGGGPSDAVEGLTTLRG